MTREFLADKTLLTGVVEYKGDDDGNMEICQNGRSIFLTPTQQQALVSLLSVNIDLAGKMK